MKEQILAFSDGTNVAYHTVGRGPGLVVVPGVLSTADDYALLALSLADAFTVHILERRGRGQSSPQVSDYGMEQERHDVQALLNATNSVHLFGHSYGGLIALETARKNTGIQKLVVYEPGVSVDGSIPIDWIENYQRLLAQNKPLGAFVDFSIALGPPAARKTPRWLMKLMMPIVLNRHDLKRKLNLLESNGREHQVVSGLNNTYENYREVSARTLILSGGKSALSWIPTMIDRVSNAVPASQTKELPKLDHFGPDRSGPRDVAQAVREFILS